ncbi:MAG TPA: YrdB family protein, partial [Aggregatilineales bacterium]|nr:YrdB family protein [Aggregatilineales bacterium]
LGLRFLLELVALFAVGYWGWTQHQGVMRFVLAIGLPALLAAAWGIFRVPGDASASGEAIVAVPGIVRLLLELVFFGLAVWAFYASSRPTWALVLGIVMLVHYALSYDRILWLLRQ